MKTVIISVITAVGLIVLAMLLASPSTGPSRASGGASADGQNVTMENGKQIVAITARGGYSPQSSVAKAGVPTILRMKTAGSFDCSSSVVIPALNVRMALPSTGERDIEVPAQQPGTVLQGTCAMGMYSFQIQFN